MAGKRTAHSAAREWRKDARSAYADGFFISRYIEEGICKISMMRFDHIGMVVPTLRSGRESLSEIFHIEAWTLEFVDPVNQVNVQFGRDPSGICYELVAPLGEGSPITRSVKTSRDILNHVAYLVDDLTVAREALRRTGASPITPARPAVAYGGRAIQFFMTKSRFVLELIEAPEHQHIYSAF